METLPSPDKLNFLIVDDMDNMRRSIRAMLKIINFGREYYEASNGRMAWKVLEDAKAPIHFIISDYNMPQMSGTELLHRIRNTKEWRDIPFLMITAEANMEVVAEAAEHDVDAYLTKPFITASLEQKILHMIEQANKPDPVAIHLKAARKLEETGRIDEAIKEVKKALAESDRSSRPMRELGRLLLKTGDLDRALISFQKATETNRLDVVSYHYMGQIYYRMGKIDKAIEKFSKAMEISPRHSDRALKFANLLIKKNKLREGKEVLKIVLRNNSSNYDLKEDVAETCMTHGFFDMAVKCYQDIISNDPDRTYLHKKLGIALTEQGDADEAIKILEDAIRRHEEDIEIMVALAKAYFEKRMIMRADKWAARAIRLDPENLEAKEILDKCT
ncbi:MAG: tetratricopeptide repeat protein [Desulfobulbaceae bacterium]|nr:tetratricopeptide repeat protein [Desulfobulbaceae bacterium]